MKGYPAAHPEARGNVAMKFYTAVDGRNPVGDQLEPEVTRLLRGAVIDLARHPDDVGRHLEPDLVIRHGDDHPDGGGARVLDYVGQGLLEHLEQGVTLG